MIDAKHLKSHAEDLMIDATNPIEASEDLRVDAQYPRTAPAVPVSDVKASHARPDDLFIMPKERCTSAFHRCTAAQALTLDTVQPRLAAKPVLANPAHGNRSPITNHRSLKGDPRHETTEAA